jgi:hypothetical protein
LRPFLRVFLTVPVSHAAIAPAWNFKKKGRYSTAGATRPSAMCICPYSLACLRTFSRRCPVLSSRNTGSLGTQGCLGSCTWQTTVLRIRAIDALRLTVTFVSSANTATFGNSAPFGNSSVFWTSTAVSRPAATWTSLAFRTPFVFLTAAHFFSWT